MFGEQTKSFTFNVVFGCMKIWILSSISHHFSTFNTHSTFHAYQHVQFWFGFMLKFLIHIEFKFHIHIHFGFKDSGSWTKMCINIYLLALFSVQCSVVVLHLNYFQNAQNSSYFAMKRNRKYKSMMLRFIVLCAVPCHIVSYEMSKKKKQPNG